MLREPGGTPVTPTSSDIRELYQKTSLPTGRDKVTAVDRMFDAIAPRYDLMNRLLTMRMDVRWRRLTVNALRLPLGSVVLDLACGTGDLCRELTIAGHHAMGIDRSGGMLAHAKTSAPLARGDSLSLPVAGGSIDGVTCGFALRNFERLEPFLAECARVLRPGGRIALLEVDTPDNPVLRAGHAVYFQRLVPFIGGLLSDRAAYGYLPESVAYLPERSALLDLLRDAGFEDVNHRPISGGIAQLLTGTRS